MARKEKRGKTEGKGEKMRGKVREMGKSGEGWEERSDNGGVTGMKGKRKEEREKWEGKKESGNGRKVEGNGRK